MVQKSSAQKKEIALMEIETNIIVNKLPFE